VYCFAIVNRLGLRNDGGMLQGFLILFLHYHLLYCVHERSVRGMRTGNGTGVVVKRVLFCHSESFGLEERRWDSAGVSNHVSSLPSSILGSRTECEGDEHWGRDGLVNRVLFCHSESFGLKELWRDAALSCNLASSLSSSILGSRTVCEVDDDWERDGGGEACTLLP
jgi:hypothetical protein